MGVDLGRWDSGGEHLRREPAIRIYCIKNIFSIKKELTHRRWHLHHVFAPVSEALRRHRNLDPQECRHGRARSA